MGQTKSTAAVPRRKREIRVWGAGSNVPLQVCEDARLRGGEWKNATYGQAGWDWGINFADFSDLTKKLQGDTPSQTCGNHFFDCDPLGDGELLELAINCHGGPGLVDVDCKSTSASMTISTSEAALAVMDITTLPKFSAQFSVLNRLLAPDHGVLWFMCCMTGQSQRGSDFLCAVSKLLPGRDVLALATVGYSNAGAMIRSGTGMGEPGMRDTEFLWAAPTPQIEDQRYASTWGDLGALPWASRMSPHTKIARDGNIVGGAGQSF